MSASLDWQILGEARRTEAGVGGLGAGTVAGCDSSHG
jgi:hypothetical protein